MERIFFEVDDQAGKVYNSLSVEKQRQISEAISMLLKKASNDATAADYKKLLDEFGAKTVSNGLTEEILERLLKDND